MNLDTPLRNNRTYLTQYTHILTIKVLSTDTKTIDEEMSNIVNLLFLSEEIEYNGYQIRWEPFVREYPYNFFNEKSLSTNSDMADDGLIKMTTNNTIRKIEYELIESGQLNNKKIIYNIVKPIVKKIPLGIDEIVLNR